MNEWEQYTSTFNRPEAPVLDHPPELYRAAGQATGVASFDSIGPAEVAFFQTHGYLVINKAFSSDEVNAALEALLDLIDGRNPDYKGLQFEAKAAAMLDQLTRDQKQDAVRKVWKFVDYHPTLKAFSAHAKLMNVLRQLMGEPAVLFQDMAMLKPPRIGREKPWHQDCAYFNIAPTTTVIGAWIALDEATPENGCMNIVPGTHRQGPVLHFNRRDWQICDTQIQTQRILTVPLKPGGCLLFHGLLHHGTPTNASPQRRRALQFHYRPESTREISLEERLAIYGPDGKNVEC